MSYLVLARKYRPQIFDEVIGQEHITSLIKKSIGSGRMAHAYLFCGPRGIGKTSCARILAKSLNCERGPTVTPCGICSSCTQITKGNSFDVLEIDGASNRGIDEIRSLRENVKFAASYGRYKIYIVDEVHMLTAEAFNALLKTLEEPPEYVKFIFATTAPNKVPSTIISRCQRFDFKRISLKTILSTLAEISAKEKLNVDQDALYAIAKAAEGSLRDALSIFDQMSGFSDQTIKAGDVFSMLGLVETEFLFQLTDAIAQKNTVAAMESLHRIIGQGKDLRQLIKDLLEHFRNLMVIKVGGKSLTDLVDYPGNVKAMLEQQGQQFTLPEILKTIDSLIAVQEISRGAESLMMPFEVMLARLSVNSSDLGSERSSTSRPATPSRSAVNAAPVRTSAAEVKKDVAPRTTPRAEAPNAVLPATQAAAVIEATEDVEEDLPPEIESIVESHEALTIEKFRKIWDTLTHAVSRQKMSLATCLQEGFPLIWDTPKLTVGFPQKCSFQKETLQSPANVKIVENVIKETLKTIVIMKYVDMDEVREKDEEPAVQNILETFKGKIISRWHND